MKFKTLVNIIKKYCIDTDTAENIAQDILTYHPCGDCAYYGDCKEDYEDCEYAVFSSFTDEEQYLYRKYLDDWYNTHDEGEPACISEWYDNEYQVLKYMNSSRELAAAILGQLELYGDFYYKIEDWLTNCLEGNVTDLPVGIESEYLKCALRIEVREMFDNRNIEDIESYDIEEVVDRLTSHFSHDILDIQFMSDIIDDYINEREDK